MLSSEVFEISLGHFNTVKSQDYKFCITIDILKIYNILIIAWIFNYTTYTTYTLALTNGQSANRRSVFLSGCDYLVIALVFFEAVMRQRFYEQEKSKYA